MTDDLSWLRAVHADRKLEGGGGGGGGGGNHSYKFMFTDLKNNRF